MGLLDDLQMGFGLKERTEDYDARTARTIAASEAAGGSNDAMRLAQARNPQHSSFLPVSRSRGAQQYLGSRGYDEGYTPQVAEDDRPFMQRLLFSPESAPSPTPYAIGPLTMDQPLPKFGLLGLLSGLGGMFGRDAQEMGPPQTTVRPMLRPEGFSVTPPTTDVPSLLEAGMDRFESDDARSRRAALAESVPSITPLTGMQMLDQLAEMYGPRAYNAALNDTAGITELYNKHVLGGVPLTFGQTSSSTSSTSDPAYPLGLAEKYSEAALSQMAPEMIDYLSRIEAEEQGLTPITTGPHAGKYMDAGGRLVMP